MDVRIISASNRDLAAEVMRGAFRADLYYRLNGFNIVVPPLRGRHDDIERLTLFLYENLCALLRRRAQPLPDDLRAFMRDYPWPGNIRELKMAVQKLIVMTPKGESPTLDFLKRELEGHRAALPPAATTLEEAEADVALRALVASRGNKTAAAKIMGVSKPTFFRLLKKLKIEGKISLPTGVKS